MATKIITKNSSTTTAIPTAADLVQGELAVNVTDKRLFTENSAGAIVEVGTNPSTLTVTGEITANGGIALGDNDKATFGASDDLQIYHDGSNNRLDSVSSSLVVKAPQFVVQDAEGTKNMIWVPQGGSGYEVQLSHDGTTKLTTTATGIDVTGTATMDGLTVDGGGSLTFSELTSKIIGPLNQDFIIQQRGNADTEALRIQNVDNNNLAKFDKNGDISFYEDTGTTPKFFWDASAESLGIGTTSLTTSDGSNIELSAATSSRVILASTGIGGHKWTMATGTAGGLDFYDYTASSYRFQIDSTGSATFSGDVKINSDSAAASGTKSLQFYRDSLERGRVKFDFSNSSLNLQADGVMTFMTAGENERLRIDASGRLGLGSVPDAWKSTWSVLDIGNSGSLYAQESNTTGLANNLYYNGVNWVHKNTGATAFYQQSEGAHYFYSNASQAAGSTFSPVSKMTLDVNGNLLVGSSSAPINRKLYVESVNYPAQMYATTAGINYPTLQLKNAHAAGGNTCTQIDFRNAADASVGQVKSTASATIFATSSDYRLKEDDVAMTGAIERVKALRPINFAWKLDGSRVDGFFAHELAEVVPEAATGTKDAMRDEEYEVTPAVEEVRDEDGNVTTEAVAAVMGTRSVPDYQGIDQSKLVPLLTAALQEAIAKIEDLTARIEALEGA